MEVQWAFVVPLDVTFISFGLSLLANVTPLVTTQKTFSWTPVDKRNPKSKTTKQHRNSPGQTRLLPVLSCRNAILQAIPLPNHWLVIS
jgi:hypothetical protein